MKTRKEQKQIFAKLIADEIMELETIKSTLDKIIKDKSLNESTLAELENSNSTLTILYKNLMWRYIKFLKQNHMLD